MNKRRGALSYDFVLEGVLGTRLDSVLFFYGESGERPGITGVSESSCYVIYITMLLEGRWFESSLGRPP